MGIFMPVFWVLSVLCAVLYLYTRTALAPVSDLNFKSFQRSYLVVYLMAMGGDWLQGPHVYALYESYGMSTHQIEILFVAGFGSSMIFGTFVGSIADKYGRRMNCILYGILYGMGCVTKHFANFWILMIGRLLGGIATSILYSAFESWLIYEHNMRKFEQSLLGNIFSHAVLGNSLIAILAGLVAQSVADFFGFVAPFDVSLAVLLLMVVLIIFTWPENYGDRSTNMLESFKNAWTSIKTDPKIFSLGLIQSLFEGSMYIFVLEWTPTLTPSTTQIHSADTKVTSSSSDIKTETEEAQRSIPHGHIFAAFMVTIMIGSSLFKILMKNFAIESFMRFVLFTAAVSLTMPILFPSNQLVVFIGFLVFEICVGIFWPSLSTMRGKYVPEATRATIMNIFRIPLNLIVVTILLLNLPRKVIFECCVGFLLLASISQQWLYRLYKSISSSKTTESDAAAAIEVKESLLLNEQKVEREEKETQRHP